MKTSYNGSWEAIYVGTSSSLFWAAGLSLHPLLSGKVEFLFSKSLSGPGEWASKEVAAALQAGDSRHLWMGFKEHGRQRWGKTSGYPSSCLLDTVPSGEFWGCSQEQRCISRRAFLLLPGIILGTVLHGPTQCDQRILAAWKLKRNEGLCCDIWWFSLKKKKKKWPKQNNSLLERWSSLQHSIHINLDLIWDKWEGWQHMTKAENSNHVLAPVSRPSSYCGIIYFSSLH